MRRVFYFAGDNMVVQEWTEDSLASSVYFEPDKKGLALFETYLRSFKTEPIQLLIDLIEEDFYQIDIPLLRGTDRKAVLERHLNRSFQDSEFRLAVPYAIEKKNRKEEKLLLLGLADKSALEPWLGIITDTQTPLSGIISLPLLSENLIAEIGGDSHVTILISQSISNNLRQSVFIGGKLILSRLTPIASFYDGDYADDVVHDFESTQRYLISQYLIENSNSMAIHIFTHQRHVNHLTMKFTALNFSNVHVHEINQYLEMKKIRVSEVQKFSLPLFCYLASQKASLNHYACSKQRKYYLHNQTKRVFKLITMMSLVIGTGLSFVCFAKGLLYKKTIAETVSLTQEYQARLNQLSHKKPNPTISAVNMQHMVQTIERLSHHFLQYPQAMMTMISQDVSRFSTMRVRRMEWFVSNLSDTQQASSVDWRQSTVKRKKNKSRPDSSGGYGFFQIAKVEAEFPHFDGDYRKLLNTVHVFETAMRQSGLYFAIDITKKPLNIEPHSHLSGDVVKRQLSSDARAGVSFRLVRKINTDG